VTKVSEAVPANPRSLSDTRQRPIERLTRRWQFLNAAKGKRCHVAAFTLQCVTSTEREPKRRSRSRYLAPGESTANAGLASKVCDNPPRFGFTVTKKIGGAVVRNRIRRRLRAAVQNVDPLPARPGQDYVIVARREALGMPFPLLKESLARALLRLGGADAATGTAEGGSEKPPRRHRGKRGSRAHSPPKDRTGEAPRA